MPRMQTNTLVFALAGILLALGTLSTKAAGAAWLLLALAGVGCWLAGRRDESARALAPASAAEADLPARLAKVWLLATLGALALKSVPMFYWSGPWQERHAEFRLLIGAIGTWGLLRWGGLAWRAPQHMRFLGHGLAAACALAWGLCVTITSDAAPTNRIPWAAGVALFSCVLLGWAFAPGRAASSTRQRQVWFWGSLMGMLAILASGVRGSYALLLLWPALAIYLQHRHRLFKRGWLVALATVMAMALTIALTPPKDSLLYRAQIATTEMNTPTNELGVDVNSSTGVRWLLWKGAWDNIPQHWGLGLGFDGAKALIKQIADHHNSTLIHEMKLGHFHSDYVHTQVEYGLWGLASYLLYGGTLLWLSGCLLRKKHITCGLPLLGVALLHLSSGLTNVNFGHNYYPVTLSLAVTCLLIRFANTPTP